MLAFAALFAAMEAGGGFGEVGVDTLAVSRYGAGIFPYLFIGLGTLEPRRGPGLRHGARSAAAGPVPVRAAVRGRRDPPPRTTPDGDGTPADGAAGLADGLCHRRVRGDDRLDDGRVRLRCPPGEAPLPAVHRRGHRRAGSSGRWRRARSRPPSAPRASSCCRPALLAVVGAIILGDRPHRHGSRAAPPARCLGHRRAARRVRWRRSLAADAPRRDRVRPPRDPDGVGDLPVHAAARGHVHDRGQPGDRARPVLCRGHGGVADRLDPASPTASTRDSASPAPPCSCPSCTSAASACGSSPSGSRPPRSSGSPSR